MKYKHTATLTNLVHDAGHSLCTFARWPDTEARRIAADNDVGALRAALRGYDPVVPRALMTILMADMLDEMFVRDCPIRGIRLALDKMIDIFDRSKDE